MWFSLCPGNGALVCGVLLIVSAPSGRGAPPSDEFSGFRADSHLVLIPVSVTDALDRPVMNLDKNDFRVFEGSVEQRVQHISREDVPLAVGLIFDSSLSMGPKLKSAQAAASTFLKTANPEDEFFLVEFQDRARISQAPTDDLRVIQARLDAATAHGHTALLDAISLGLQQLHKSSKPRKALLIFSDGGDNHSRYTKAEVKSLVRESDVVIYSIGLFDPGRKFLPEELGPGESLLEDFTRDSGGRLFTLDGRRDMSEIANTIGTEMHNRYVIAYYPANLNSSGKFHKVQVRVIPPHGSHALRVSWRSGYYDPAPTTDW